MIGGYEEGDAPKADVQAEEAKEVEKAGDLLDSPTKNTCLNYSDNALDLLHRVYLYRPEKGKQIEYALKSLAERHKNYHVEEKDVADILSKEAENEFIIKECRESKLR